jgi:hypothetical protein
MRPGVQGNVHTCVCVGVPGPVHGHGSPAYHHSSETQQQHQHQQISVRPDHLSREAAVLPNFAIPIQLIPFIVMAVQFGGKLDWDATAICGDDHEYGGRGNPSTGDRFHAAPNIDHSQNFVRDGIVEWLTWLRSDVGIDGYRLDFAKGFAGLTPACVAEPAEILRIRHSV